MPAHSPTPKPTPTTHTHTTHTPHPPSPTIEPISADFARLLASTLDLNRISTTPTYPFPTKSGRFPLKHHQELLDFLNRYNLLPPNFPHSKKYRITISRPKGQLTLKLRTVKTKFVICSICRRKNCPLSHTTTSLGPITTITLPA